MFEYLVCALACLRLSIHGGADEALTCRSPKRKATERLIRLLHRPETAKGAYASAPESQKAPCCVPPLTSPRHGRLLVAHASKRRRTGAIALAKCCSCSAWLITLFSSRVCDR